MRPAAFAIVATLVAASANASWLPVFSPNVIQLRPGQSTTITAQGAWFGWSYVPFMPMTFTAADPAIAAVTGSLPTTKPVSVQITALQPGVTRLGVLQSGGAFILPTSPIIVVADRELAVSVAASDPQIVGQNVTLSAASDDPDATYAWYGGRPNGDLSIWQVGTGPTVTVVPLGLYVHEYWVLATSPRGAAIATIAFHPKPAPRRRRATGH